MASDLRVDGRVAPPIPPAPQSGLITAPGNVQPQGPRPPASQALGSPPSPPLPNPRLHTDLELNRLVLEFFDSQGALTASIPSQKQLDAYRLAAHASRTHSK